MIKVSHEVPLSLMEQSRQFNDYDYALAHLVNFNVQYKDFFVESRKLKRDVFLDNSCYELGKPVQNAELYKATKLCSPTHVILPDYPGSKDKTLDYSLKFTETIKKLEYQGKFIGVIQGENYDEYVECYKSFDKELREGDWIAIPFRVRGFDEEAMKSANTGTQVHAYSRILLIQKMMKDNIINTGRDHHLLGCSDPVEFSTYTYNYHRRKKYQFIKSLDTSCPVILAMFKKALGPSGLGEEKLAHKVADNMEKVLDESQMKLLDENIGSFRSNYLARRWTPQKV